MHVEGGVHDGTGIYQHESSRSVSASVCVCARACVCVCARARAIVCVCGCVRASEHACVHSRVLACGYLCRAVMKGGERSWYRLVMRLVRRRKSRRETSIRGRNIVVFARGVVMQNLKNAARSGNVGREGARQAQQSLTQAWSVAITVRFSLSLSLPVSNTHTLQMHACLNTCTSESLSEP